MCPKHKKTTNNKNHNFLLSQKNKKQGTVTYLQVYHIFPKNSVTDNCLYEALCFKETALMPTSALFATLITVHIKE
jgi:hypothetical protein